MKFILAALALFLATSANAQSVQQSGYVTPGHAVEWLTNGVVKDAGAPNGSGTGGTQYGTVCSNLSPYSFFANTSAAPTGTTVGIYDTSQCDYWMILNQSAHTIQLTPTTLTIGNAPEVLEQGPSSPIAGTTAQVDWQTQGVSTTALQWPTVLGGNNTGVKAWNSFAYGYEITSTKPFSSIGEAVISTDYCVMSYGNASGGVGGNPSQCVPHTNELMLNANNAAGVGTNIIISSPSAYSGLQFNGVEVDAIITANSTFSGAHNTHAFVALAGNNTYGGAISISSFYTSGSPNGYWLHGIDINQLAPNGVGISFSDGGETTMSIAAGIDCGSTTYVTYSIGCLMLETGQVIQFGTYGSGTTNGLFIYDGSNLEYRNSSSGAFIIQNNAGNSNLFTFSESGLATIGNLLLTSAAPTAASSQVGLGSTVEAAGSGTCPSGTVGGQTVAGCLIINVAGTTHYAPYF